MSVIDNNLLKLWLKSKNWFTQMAEKRAQLNLNKVVTIDQQKSAAAAQKKTSRAMYH